MESFLALLLWKSAYAQFSPLLPLPFINKYRNFRLSVLSIISKFYFIISSFKKLLFTVFYKQNDYSCLPLYLNAHHRPFWNIFLLSKFFPFNHFKYDWLVFSGGVRCVFDNDSFDIKNSFIQYRNRGSHFPLKTPCLSLLWRPRCGEPEPGSAPVSSPSGCVLPSESSQCSFSSLRVDGPSRDLFSQKVMWSFEQQIEFFLPVEHGFFSDASEHAALSYLFRPRHQSRPPCLSHVCTRHLHCVSSSVIF